MESRRCLLVVFMGHYRDWMQRKHKNKLFNLYNLLFERPKMNRRTISRRCFIDVFMGHYRDWIIFFWGERSDPLQWTRSRGSLRSPQEINYSISLFSCLKDPKWIAEWKVVDVSWLFLWDIIEIEFKENIRTNKFNLSFFLFERPKNNRRMESRRCSRDLFMRHYRDWMERKT